MVSEPFQGCGIFMPSHKSFCLHHLLSFTDSTARIGSEPSKVARWYVPTVLPSVTPQHHLISRTDIKSNERIRVVSTIIFVGLCSEWRYQRIGSGPSVNQQFPRHSYGEREAASPGSRKPAPCHMQSGDCATPSRRSVSSRKGGSKVFLADPRLRAHNFLD
jgi:hypothetical protein